MKNDVSELRKLVRDLLEEMSVRITDRSDSSMPEWERKAEKLGCYDKSTAISHAPKGRFLFAQGVKDNFCHISFNMDDGKIINLQIPDFQLEKMVDNLERVSKSTFWLYNSRISFSKVNESDSRSDYCMAIDSLKEIKMSNSSILAKQAEENQPVVLLGVDNEHKILVRGDFGGGNGYSATIPMLFPGKIPFAEIGFIKDGRFKFHPMPVDIVNLSENQVLESISCSLDSWL